MKLKKLTKILTSLAVLTCTLSCVDEYISSVQDKDVTFQLGITGENIYSMNLELANVAFLNPKVAVIASEPWEIISGNTDEENNWCGFYKDNILSERVMEAEGSTFVTFNMEKNKETATRSAKFVFRLKRSGVEKELTIIQNQAPYELAFVIESKNLKANETEFSVLVSANIPYEMNIEGDWLKLNRSTDAGNGNILLDFVATENNTQDMRNAEVSLKNTELDKVTILKVTQYFKMADIKITDNLNSPTLDSDPSSFDNILSWNQDSYPKYAKQKISLAIAGENVAEIISENPAETSFNASKWVEDNLLLYPEGCNDIGVTVSLFDADDNMRAVGIREINPYFAGGKGTVEEPYVISNYGQLDNVRMFLDKAYVLADDIDFSAAVPEPQKYETGAFVGTTNFLPIGSNYAGEKNNPFMGTFDGNGKRILNFMITETPSDAQFTGTALFGAIAGKDVKSRAVVRNLTVEGKFNIGGKKFVGGIIGKAQDYADILHCTSKVDINITAIAPPHCFAVGGIVGMVGIYNGNTTFPAPNNLAPIKNIADVKVEGCSNHGNITSSNGLIGFGGIVGTCLGTISKCYNSGNIDIRGNGQRVGGIVGELNGNNISECTNEGNISGFGNTGGIVGVTRLSTLVGTVGNVRDCSNHGNIHSIKSSGPGGICANAASQNSAYGYFVFTNCYNTGEVTAAEPAKIGSIIGTMANKTETTVICSYSIAGNNFSDKDGVIDEYSTIRTPEELLEQSNFNGWDFTTIWKMGAKGPELRNIQK